MGKIRDVPTKAQESCLAREDSLRAHGLRPDEAATSANGCRQAFCRMAADVMSWTVPRSFSCHCHPGASTSRFRAGEGVRVARPLVFRPSRQKESFAFRAVFACGSVCEASLAES